MSKKVEEVQDLIPLMTVEKIAAVKREISQELDKPSADRETFSQAFNRIAAGLCVQNEDIEIATMVSLKSVYRYRNENNNCIPKPNTLIKLCVGMRLHRMQTDYLFGLAGYQIKLNEPYYDIYQYYFDFCAVRKDLTVESLLEKTSLTKKE